MNLKSIRWRLPLSYAAIAIIAALVLGGTLLAIVRSYYQAQERNYLQKNAIAISNAIAPYLAASQDSSTYLMALKAHLSLFSLLAQTRVRLLDAKGSELLNLSVGDKDQPGTVVSAISQPLGTRLISPAAGEGNLSAKPGASGAIIATAPAGAGENLKPDGPITTGPMAELLGIQILNPNPDSNASPSGQPGPVKILAFTDGTVLGSSPEKGGHANPANQTFVSVIPAVSTMYGFDLQGGSRTQVLRSREVFRQDITSSDGTLLGSVELSEGPAYGSAIVAGVARGWVLASLVAVVIAALVGWWVSRRMSAPLLGLTEATRRMAGGDLSTRIDQFPADEFGSLGRAFNEMADRVEKTISSLNHFASDAAHELRSPLTALRTNLELLRQEPGLKAETAGLYEQAWDQVQRLETLTRNLLDLSRLEASEVETNPRPVDLGLMLREACEPYASRAEQAGVDFSLEVPEEPVSVPGNREQLCQAVGNLLDNALKFTPAGGRITVALTRLEGRAELSVEDSGVGIPAEDLPYIFNRFHRGRNASAYPGSGLGLAIVRAIVERAGGEIEAQNGSGGTRFRITFPERLVKVDGLR